MNPDLALLQPYPFAKLATLFEGTSPSSAQSHIALSIGEPKHTSPAFVGAALTAHMGGLSQYPLTKGILELRTSISAWATKRFHLASSGLCPETQILPVNGTREALFSFTQVIVDRTKSNPLVVCPNPFYQIYEGATYLAGAKPYFLPCESSNGYLPNYESVPTQVWQDCQMLFVCSPGNPTGAVTDISTWKKLIALADEHDFIIASDECYSELYFDEANPPVGLLQACAAMGRHDYKHCMVFHSLSKRSNLPGLRSGFVAGDAELIESYLQYRTYHGCAMPVQHQFASIAAWNDEGHVFANRQLYREKFARVLEILAGQLKVSQPDASFYLWPETPIDDTQFARELFQHEHVTVLPGQFLSREIDGLNPGAGHVRMALVAPIEQCIEAAERIKHFIQHF